MKNMFDLILSRNTPPASHVCVTPEIITLELGVSHTLEERADGIHLYGATLQGIADAIELARIKQFRRVYVHTTRWEECLVFNLQRGCC